MGPIWASPDGAQIAYGLAQLGPTWVSAGLNGQYGLQMGKRNKSVDGTQQASPHCPAGSHLDPAGQGKFFSLGTCSRADYRQFSLTFSEPYEVLFASCQ